MDDICDDIWLIQELRQDSNNAIVQSAVVLPSELVMQHWRRD